MRNGLLLTNQHFQDLNPLIAGEETCRPGHRFGPSIRPYTLMHYVVSGQGTFYARGQIYTVRQGQVFLILPGETTTYVADEKDPWHYRWIGFDGSLTRRFQELAPVFTLEENVFPTIFIEKDDPMPEYRIASGLFLLYAHFFPGRSTANQHVSKVENFIRSAYMQDLRVEKLAKDLGLDRRYLTRLFKQVTGKSIQEYLIYVRMEEANRCLCQGYTVKETARLCGYEDVSNFSRMYKKHFGLSPGSTKIHP